MNFDTARANMIDQQIRPWNVLEMSTIKALGEIRREDFVPKTQKALSYADVQIPIGNNEVMLEPKVGARMVEILNLDNSSKTLVIGTGTGYITALIATLCEHVTSLEIDIQLQKQAEINLAMAGITNIKLIQSDCFEYCQQYNDDHERFDRILVTGSSPLLSDSFCKMINTEGCIVGIEGHRPAMQVVTVRSDGSTHSHFETNAPRLKNIVEVQKFSF